MNMIKDDLIKLIDGLSQDEMEELFIYLKWKLMKKETLSEEAIKEMHEGQDEITRGEWVRWRDVRRNV